MNPPTTLGRHYRSIALRLLIIAVLAILQPVLWSFVHQTAQQVHAARSQQEQIDEVATRVKQIEQARAASQEFVDQLDTVIPASERLPQIIERIERLALDQQVELIIRDIVETPPNEDDDTGQLFLPIRVSAQMAGNVPALLAFLDAVENLPELTFLEGWNLTVFAPTPLPEATISATTTITLTAHIVFFVQTPHVQ